MKVNSTVALTLILLSLMVGAGVVSAAWGYALGREALKGVTQPDVRPNAYGTGGKPRHEEMTIIPEEKLVEDVKARMEGRAVEPAPNPSPSVSPQANSGSPAAQAIQVSNTQPAAVNVAIAPPATFPLVSQNQGVTLQVRSVERQGDAMLLSVSLQNSGSQPVQFLYSVMSITDNLGRSFSVTTQGLPEELPPGGQPFSGVMSIPGTLLEGSETLSVSLADYPAQQIQLKVSDIPIMR